MKSARFLKTITLLAFLASATLFYWPAVTALATIPFDIVRLLSFFGLSLLFLAGYVLTALQVDKCFRRYE